MIEINELELTLLIRNNRIKKYRKERGLTQRQFGALLGLRVATMSQAERFDAAPHVQQIIAAHMEVSVDYLFPPAIIESLKATTITKEIPADALPLLAIHEQTRLLPPSPEELLLQGEVRDRTQLVLKTLKPREEMILKMRFGVGDGQERTRQDIAREFGVSSARIGQIESKAMRRLRHPSRSQRLRQFLEAPAASASIASPLHEEVRCSICRCPTLPNKWGAALCHEHSGKLSATYDAVGYRSYSPARHSGRRGEAARKGARCGAHPPR